MRYTYSICDPSKEEIIYIDSIFNTEQIIDIAKNYSWIEKLKNSNSLSSEEAYYCPSLDFTNIENNRKFGLSAQFDKDKDLEFSLWYERPKQVKSFFGLFDTKEKMMVDSIFAFKLSDSLYYLTCFTQDKFDELESLYQ